MVSHIDKLNNQLGAFSLFVSFSLSIGFVGDRAS